MTKTLDPSRIPVRLHHLIPLAEKFGISDDGYRQDLIEASSREELASLKAAVDAVADDLDEWLAGPEADAENVSDEYVAFTCMTMAADWG